MNEVKRTGHRRVELLIPIEIGKVTIDAIEFKPCRLDHELRWQEGKFSGPMALMAELSGRTEDILRQMVSQDSEKVMQEFMLHLPPSIRTSVAETRFKAPEPMPAPGDQMPSEEQLRQWDREDGVDNSEDNAKLFASE